MLIGDLVGLLVGLAAAIGHRSQAASSIRWQRRLGYRRTEEDSARLFLWGGLSLMLICSLSMAVRLLGYLRERRRFDERQLRR